jgi:hypothetical protein
MRSSLHRSIDSHEARVFTLIALYFQYRAQKAQIATAAAPIVPANDTLPVETYARAA